MIILLLLYLVYIDSINGNGSINMQLNEVVS